jgi:hypothetical protein
MQLQASGRILRLRRAITVQRSNHFDNFDSYKILHYMLYIS